MERYVKQEENAGKNGKLMEPANGKEIKMIEKDVESDGQEVDETGEPQWRIIRQKYRNVRNAKFRSQLLILIPPMAVYVTAIQVPVEITIMELRK